MGLSVFFILYLLRFLLQPRLDDHGSARSSVTLLRSWIRRFGMIISAWWLEAENSP